MTRTVETMTAREFERMRALTAIETYPDGSEIYYCARCSFQHEPLTAGANRCPDCHSVESLCYVKNDAEFMDLHASLQHEQGCPAIADDDSDQVLADYGECACRVSERRR